MSNIFFSPTKTLKGSLEEPNVFISLIIVLIVGLGFGSIFILGLGNLALGLIITLTTIVQWLVLSVIYYLFEFMFTEKRKGMIQTNLPGILTAMGQLWLMILVFEIFFAIGLLGGLFSAIAGIAAFVILILLLINSFILMKVLIDSSNLRVFIAWILAIIIYMLILAFAQAITLILV